VLILRHGLPGLVPDVGGCQRGLTLDLQSPAAQSSAQFGGSFNLPPEDLSKKEFQITRGGARAMQTKMQSPILVLSVADGAR
jgi:hypothetical protein